jgi:hypothetical protein
VAGERGPADAMGPCEAVRHEPQGRREEERHGAGGPRLGTTRDGVGNGVFIVRARESREELR